MACAGYTARQVHQAKLEQKLQKIEEHVRSPCLYQGSLAVACLGRHSSLSAIVRFETVLKQRMILAL
jgi:hypothetical protein